MDCSRFKGSCTSYGNLPLSLMNTVIFYLHRILNHIQGKCQQTHKMVQWTGWVDSLRGHLSITDVPVPTKTVLQRSGNYTNDETNYKITNDETNYTIINDETDFS